MHSLINIPSSAGITNCVLAQLVLPVDAKGIDRHHRPLDSSSFFWLIATRDNDTVSIRRIFCQK